MHSPSFVFPNDVHVAWSIMIVLYPYITGLVAGAFVVSALYHVFHDHKLKPVARLALVTALCFCSCATVPLLPVKEPIDSLPPKVNVPPAMVTAGVVPVNLEPLPKVSVPEFTLMAVAAAVPFNAVLPPTLIVPAPRFPATVPPFSA